MSQLSHIVNHQRYPIKDLICAAGCSFLSECRQQLNDCGLCLLEEFVQPEALEQMQSNALAGEQGHSAIAIAIGLLAAPAL